ncbi:MAG: UDP-N-acetylglucosamine--N-acetylmuramyl-(pentapeptide) pyrophosphoryl-undecaprenol N-acetylglucosamine transferase [Thermaceae bacterium]
MVLITGGGTGGHFFPGLAVAQALRKRGVEVVYGGSERGLEARLLPEQDLPYLLVPAGKLDRSGFRPREALEVLRGVYKAFLVLRKLKPRLILSTGGYAGFPLAYAGERMGIKVLVHEQNAKLGLAVRLLAPRAKGLALSVPLDLPSAWANKARLVGYPVREVRYDKREARRMLGLKEDEPLILVLGGSQGSQELNTRLPPLLKGLPYTVLHQVGWAFWERMKPLEEERYRILPFVETPLAMSAADLLISRAGAGTLAEAAYHHLPAILFPLPPSLDGGAQLSNAQLYQKAGGALLGRYEELPSLVEGLFKDLKNGLPKLKEGMARLSPEGAANRLAEWILEEL